MEPNCAFGCCSKSPRTPALSIRCRAGKNQQVQSHNLDLPDQPVAHHNDVVGNLEGEKDLGTLGVAVDV